MQQSTNTILTAARAIPQAYADREHHSLEWRYLLQCIRNADACTTTSKACLLARIYQASLPIFVVSGDEPFAAQKNAILDAIAEAAKRHEFGFGELVGDVSLPAITGAHGEVLAEAE